MRPTDKRIAIVVDPSLAIGLIANTVATIAVGLGAAEPSFGNVTLTDAAGRLIKNSADRPVPILQAPAAAIRATLLKALPTREDEIVVPFLQFARKALPTREGEIVVPFLQFARNLHSFAEYRAQLAARDIATETIEGLGLAGPEKWVKSLTGSLKLLR
jgi:uncharacterized protein DUF2000